MYTNFETMDGLERQLPYLKAISKSHLLVVIFFKNTELNDLIKNKAETVQQVYDKVNSLKIIAFSTIMYNEYCKCFNVCQVSD